MWVYIARRLVWLPIMLFMVSAVTFALFRIVPGDPVTVMLGARYNEATAARLREALDLDKPFVVQYASYMWGVIRPKIHTVRIGEEPGTEIKVPFLGLDFGESFRFRGRPVGPLMRTKMWVSFQVNMAGMVVALGLGLPLGFWVAHRQGTSLDPITVALAVILASLPIMVTAPAILWAGCLQLDLLPCSGWGGLFDVRIVAVMLAMGVPGIAGFIRIMRASTLDVLGQDFIRTAHSKGMSSMAIDYKHVLRNALIPIVTVLAFSLSGMLTTSFVAERIFGIPGIGSFAIDSLFNRDYPVMMGMTIVLTTAFVLSILAADIAYAYVDPRIRYDTSQGEAG